MIRVIPLLLALIVTLPAAAQKTVAIKNAKIYTVAGTGSGDVIASGTILIVDGKIKAVGTDVKIPEYDVKVIDAKGGAVVPGLVVAHTYSGTDAANENLPVTPFVSTVDSVDPSSLFFEGQRRNGVTTLGIFPGNKQPVAGTGIVVKIRSNTVAGMLVRRDAGLKLSFDPGKPDPRSPRRTRMWAMTQIRSAFTKALDARKKHADAKSKADAAKKKNPKAKVAAVKDIDFRLLPLLEAIDGNLPCYVHCTQAGDVQRAIDMRKTHPKMKLSVILAGDAFRAHAAIKAAKIPVILDPGLEYRKTDPETDREALWPIASVLRKNGLTFSLSPTHRSRTLVTGHLWFQGAVAIKWGLSTADALKAVTLWPAQTLGIADRVGSIEVGKDADLVVLSGEPFRIRTFVHHVLIDGVVKYDKSKDPWEARLYYKAPKTQR